MTKVTDLFITLAGINTTKLDPVVLNTHYYLICRLEILTPIYGMQIYGKNYTIEITLCNKIY